jgi:two-component sensor histidine kinase/HAMP domain-containing protein
MRFSIRNKIILISVAILVITLAANTLICSIFFTRTYSTALISKTFMAGGTLKHQLEKLLKYNIPLNNLVGFEEQCQDIIHHYGDISYAMVVDLKGKILFHNEPSKHGEVIRDQDILPSLNNRTESLHQYKDNQEEFYAFTIPIEEPSHVPIGAVIIGFPKNLIAHKVAQMVLYATGVAVVFLVLGVASLIMGLKLWVTNPLSQLMGAIQNIRTTGTDQVELVGIESRDEIGELSAAFNDMILQVQKSQAKLQNYAAELEYKVQKSTAHLKELNDRLRQDIQARQQAEAQIKATLLEKEILLREIHHRVKNNLQIISSLLNLQARTIQDSRIKELFQDCNNRIRSMALIHESLYRSSDLSRINIQEYIKSLAQGLFKSYGGARQRIRLNVDIEDITLSIDTAIPCGLIISELISNSLKHAFPEGREGVVDISVHALENGELALTVRDNGVGIPESFDFNQTQSIGLSLVTGLVEQQLQGKIRFNRGNGTEIKIYIKELTYKKRI